MSDVCLCVVCGCEGNESCGHKPLKGETCSLDMAGVCPCCNHLGNHCKVV